MSSETRVVPPRIPAWVDDVVAALFSLAVGACVFLSWPLDLHTPIVTGGDATSAQYVIKSILEHGSYTRNPDVGAPFGATMYDYPMPEPTHHAFFRLLGLFSKDPFLAFNLFYLLGFAVAAYTACWALRRNGIGRWPAIAGAIAFALLPFHFRRFGHVFLASYAAIPVFAHYTLQLATYRAPHVPGTVRIGALPLLAIAVAAGTGVYYAWFGLLFIVFAAALGAAQSRRWQPLRVGAAFAATIVAVIALSLLPNALYHASEGANAAVAARQAFESEMYGLRITQLLFPTPGHRIAVLDAFMADYKDSVQYVNENSAAALGIVGAIGFMIALGAVFFGDARRHAALWATGAACAAGVLYATIGGFGAIVGRLLTPELRGLNRISVFIGFFALYALLCAFEIATRGRRRRAVDVAFTAVVVAVACFDQIPGKGLVHQSARVIAPRKALYARIRAALPGGARVFELPYTYFPESPHRVGSYSLLEPYLFTQGLEWSFGDMHGRPADVWNEQVAALDGDDLAGALALAGFSAIYVDRRGYEDGGAAVERGLRAHFGAPIVEDANLGRAVYRVPPPRPGMVPHVAVDLGRGWKAAGGDAASAAGDADLVVANPTSSPVSLALRFRLDSATSRKLVLSYGDQVITAYSVRGGERVEASVSIQAQPGVSRLLVGNEAPIAAAAQDAATKPSVRISGLAWGVTGRF
ncbi:hypothetical protein [Dokdonella fugitiva]|jgi:phosphoglycerol transferase|uniref:Phosphoglycerol transferase n=1 Tax=Dokdonella fugitiva TaxID=328517 RepID=A0A4R2IDU3_9GAMM|nr:hypothetical protein [Dokdonella fugitiva]TCO42764.1 phosphoglycerol transferase [Dokdonella fugitiva]